MCSCPFQFVSFSLDLEGRSNIPTRKKGVQVSSVLDFNNTSASLVISGYPRPYINGQDGYCPILAMYYIAPGLTDEKVRELQGSHHTPVEFDKDTYVHCTDGTKSIIRAVNRSLVSESFEQIYPSSDFHRMDGNENSLFGNNNSGGGKFLIELGANEIIKGTCLTHFVSFDTVKMELYDPINSRGAIQVHRNSEGECLFQQAVQMLHVTYNMLTILKVWKLELKRSSISLKRKNEEDENFNKKKKKRRGKKQF